jgi:hypothetical protein
MSSATDRMLEGVHGLLEQAGDDRLLKALRLIESLDHRGSLDEAVARVRPRLAVLRPIRGIGLRRLVTLPFEDLLVRGEAWVAGRGRIARSTLSDLHAVIVPALPAELASRVGAAAKGRFMNEQAIVLGLGRELWPAAAAVLEARLASADALSPDPAGEAAMREQMRSAALLLVVAPVIVPLLWRLPPRPMPELVDDERKAALELLRVGIAGGPALLEQLFRLLLMRTASPSSILELAFLPELGLPAQETDRLVARATALCVAELNATVPAPVQQGRALATAADDIERLVGCLRSLEGGPARLALERGTLLEIRGKAARSITGTLTATMGGMLSQHFASLHGDRPVTDVAMAELEEAARATRRIGIAGRDLGLGDSVERILAEFRPVFAPPASVPPASAAGPGASEADPSRFDRARIVEILFGPEAAMALLRSVRPGR